MSYIVHILPPPVPEDDAAAWEFMLEIAERRPEGEVPQVFHELMDRLTRRYPCICDLPDDDLDDGVWSDGPLRNNATHAITILGISFPHVEKVQPFVVSTANALGLIVFDDQVGKIYRPTKERGKGPSKAAGKGPRIADQKKRKGK